MLFRRICMCIRMVACVRACTCERKYVTKMLMLFRRTAAVMFLTELLRWRVRLLELLRWSLGFSNGAFLLGRPTTPRPACRLKNDLEQRVGVDEDEGEDEGEGEDGSEGEGEGEGEDEDEGEGEGG